MNLLSANLICNMKKYGAWTLHIKNALKVSQKKLALCYYGGHWYSNMKTNFSKSFNNILKNTHAMPIYALVQLTLYRCNGYWVKRRCKASDVIQSGVI